MVEQAEDQLKQALAAIKQAYREHDSIEAARLSEEAVTDYPDSADAWAMVCHFRLWKGHHEEAVTAMEMALELGPESAMAWAARAELMAFDGCVDDARAAADRAMDLNDEDGWVIRRCSGACQFSDSRLAIEMSRRGSELDPDSDAALCHYINTLAAAGADGWQELLDDAQKRFPDSPLVMQIQARRLRMDRRLNEAVVILRKASEKVKGSHILLGELAMTLCHVGQLDEAEVVAREAIALSSCANLAMMTMANVCRKRGQDAEAATWETKAKDAIPALRTMACLREGNAAFRARDNEKAVQIVDAALPTLTATGKKAALGLKVRALLQMGDLDKAESVIDELDSMDHGSCNQSDLMGTLLAKKGQYAEAADVFGNALARFPYSGALRAGLLSSLHALGKREEEIALVDGLWQHVPQTPCEYSELARALDEAGYLDDCRRIRALGLEKYPGDEILLTLLAVDLAKVGDFAGAKRIAEQLKGDMREASGHIKKASAAGTRMQQILEAIRRRKENGGKPPTLN